MASFMACALWLELFCSNLFICLNKKAFQLPLVPHPPWERVHERPVRNKGNSFLITGLQLGTLVRFVPALVVYITLRVGSRGGKTVLCCSYWRTIAASTRQPPIESPRYTPLATYVGPHAPTAQWCSVRLSFGGRVLRFHVDGFASSHDAVLKGNSRHAERGGSVKRIPRCKRWTDESDATIMQKSFIYLHCQ